jgi:hypothetical protein
MEDGHAMQEERHIYANFNCQGFVSNVLHKAFGNPIFYQVIIDYFWCPDSWKKSFFRSNTLPKFADLGMVCGAVYLPFSLYCIKQVILAIDILSQYYNIGFMEKRNLGEYLAAMEWNCHNRPMRRRVAGSAGQKHFPRRHLLYSYSQ